MHESGRRAGAARSAGAPAGRVPPELPAAPRLYSTACAGLTLSLVNAYSVFLKFAKLWELQQQTPKAATPNNAPDRTDGLCSPCTSTRRATWRGGQSQVTYTVLGPARASATARRSWRTRRASCCGAMSEGLDLIPLAPRHEIDLAAAWRLSRVLKQLRPDVIHAHDPHARGHGRHGAVDRGAEAAAAARRLAAHRVPHRAQLVLALEVLAGRLLPRDQPGAFATGWSPTASRARRSRSSTKAWTSSASSRCRAATCTRSCSCRRTRRSSATSARWCAQKGQHTLIDAAALVVRRCRTSRFVILGEGELRPALEKQIKQKHLERHVFLAGFRADVLELTEGLRRVRAQLDARGDVHGARRRDGGCEAGGGHGRRRHPGGDGGRRDRLPGAAARSRGDGRRASCGCSRTQALRAADGTRPAWRARDGCSPSSGWSRRRRPSTSGLTTAVRTLNAGVDERRLAVT